MKIQRAVEYIQELVEKILGIEPDTLSFAENLEEELQNLYSNPELRV
ncbi:MAG: hypothetical protein H7A25_24545 [Leptospiraceae bacterium]|nr:hypothetical protein [Leptospiraceae bacterium]MCP5503091.1 hypothetical protein [Leptospiraceae bacterium]